MLTALPSDWKLQVEETLPSSPGSSSEMSPVNESSSGAPPVRLEKGFYAGGNKKSGGSNHSSGSGGLSGDALPWKGSGGGGSYHNRTQAPRPQQQPPSDGGNPNTNGAPLYQKDRWSAAQSSSAASVNSAGRDSYNVWNEPDTSQHSRSSIWADDHSAGSSTAGANNYGPYASFSKRSGIPAHEDFSMNTVDPINLREFSALSVQPSAHISFPHPRGGPGVGSAMSYEEDLTGSSFFETATVAGYPSQDYGTSGAGFDFHSGGGGAASVDSSSIPGVMPASSGSTYGTAHSLFSAGSADMAPPPPPPGFHGDGIHRFSNPGHHHNDATTPRGGRRPARRGVRGGGGASASVGHHPSGSRSLHGLGPLQETGRNSMGQRHRGGGGGNKGPPSRAFGDTAFTASEESSVASNQSIDISTSSEAIRQLMKPKYTTSSQQVDSLGGNDSGHFSITEREEDFAFGGRLPPTLENTEIVSSSTPILPQHVEHDDGDDISLTFHEDEDFTFNEEDGFPLEGDDALSGRRSPLGAFPPTASKKKDWLLRMNRKMQECTVGELDPTVIPVSAVMNGWAKSKSTQGAAMVEEWLQRAEEEYAAGNSQVIPTTKMYTMAVDAWARSGKGGAAAQRAEALLQQMYNLYKAGGNEALKPTTGIFNAVINAWARSLEQVAPQRAEQILEWMDGLGDLDVRPDKYTFNTVIHAYSKAGGKESAIKAQDLLTRMQTMHGEGNVLAKADTITYNCVINCWAKSSRGGEAANEAEKLLNKMHQLYEQGDPDVKPNVVTYGAVIDAFAKSGQRGAASKADGLLANMIRLHQSDPITHADLMPNTYVFNTVINCWSKSKERDAASKAEEMLVAMGRLHASGMTSLKPDAFTYTAVIDAWSKSFLRGAADRASVLLDKMETKYHNGDNDLKPNTFTYNAVINALAKSCEAGAAARAERVLQNMVNRHRSGGGDDVKPTTINFNTVLDAWAKSGGGRPAAERAEEILEWMDRLCKQGNNDVAPDTISFNAVLDAWARSGDRNAPRRCEQILDHMDELYRAGNQGVKPDTYTYNTLINSWAKSSINGSASRAEHVLQVMEKRYRDGDSAFKPNTRTYTSVIDAWAKSSERSAARRCESILNGMIQRYEETRDEDSRPNVHTANAVCNACAFSKHEDDRGEALQIAFRVFDWLRAQPDLQPDSYTYTILLSVCANLIPRHDTATRYAHARAFFDSCREAGYVNDYVLRKLHQTVTEQEFMGLLEYRTETSASSLPPSWSRNTKPDAPSKQRKNKWHNNRRRG